jgi:flagellar basal body rod protein FlgC
MSSSSQGSTSNESTNTRARSAYRDLSKIATLHVKQMETLGSCQIPRPQVVYPNKEFSTSNDMSGCCQHQTDSCQPVMSQTVQVVFFTQSLSHLHSNYYRSNSRNGRKRMLMPNVMPVVEVVNMINHTRCDCISQSKITSSNMENSNQLMILN